MVLILAATGASLHFAGVALYVFFVIANIATGNWRRYPPKRLA